MINMKKLIATATIATSLLSCVAASATTFISASLSGTSSESTYTALGSGTRYINATGTNKTGYAKAVQIKSWAPDPIVASVYVSNTNFSQGSFIAQNTASNGEYQSYYMRWNGADSKSSAYMTLTD